MINIKKIKLIIFILLFFLTSDIFSQRNDITISGSGWKVWLDTNASWKNDSLYLPSQVNIPLMPVNTPSCGWNELYNNNGINCSIPATVEEYFAKGNPTWVYNGVSWFWKKINIPSNWKGEKIRIHFDETRMRAEVYINNKLAAYDLVSETPWEADISQYLDFGKENIIAVRITNPGGQRGWEDMNEITWGKYSIPASHDFGGISGPVHLIATQDVFIENVFIKNMLPANEKKIQVITSIKNCSVFLKTVKLKIDISPYPKGDVIFSKTIDVTAKINSSTLSSMDIEIPNAKLWNINDPNLYSCNVSIIGNELNDAISEQFGFRVFEVKKSSDGQTNFYFNGKRFRHKSAIDWGYYAGNGLYASNEMSKKSVQAAKAIGHNGINFHRCIGEPNVFKYADELGLYLYEEPGGFHAGQQGYLIKDSTFMGKIMEEKCRRMAIRDRNHPSLIIHNLCNEDNFWNSLRERVMRTINEINPTVMVCNSSGGYIYDIFQGTSSNFINHIRPYEKNIRNDYEDNHTVEDQCTGVFHDPFLFAHQYQTSNLQYWGEVHCYAGPDNWYAAAEMMKNKPSWDVNYFNPLHDKIIEYFKNNNLPNCGSGIIKTPDDVTKQAGRGMMYINGRAAQNILSLNMPDGFAINGWSGTSQCAEGPNKGGYWSSSILDEARNIKGIAEDYAYWTRDLQIVIKRMNGKYFSPDDVGLFKFILINENKLNAGDYKLEIKIKDGDGKYTSFFTEIPVKVDGGDVFAQDIRDVSIKFRNWNGGYLTIEAKLKKDNLIVADGKEQILLSNRKSFNDNISAFRGAVYKWDAAKKAIQDAMIPVVDYQQGLGKLSYICAGNIPDAASFDSILIRVKNDGTSLIIPFNKEWAKTFATKGLLAEVPNFSPCKIEGCWYGNGWGYLDYFISDQVVPGGSTIGINSWELGDISRNPKTIPQGFWPFKTNNPDCKTKAYGAFFARPDQLLVLIGEIIYGKGKITLDAAYTVDDNNAFSDMLFYNFINKSCTITTKDLSIVSTPFGVKPASIPGVIEVKDYDNGGEGISYHDDDLGNNGGEYRYDDVDIQSLLGNAFVGWINSGEWMQYTVNVEKAGDYDLEIYYSTPNTGSSFHLEFEGKDKSGIIDLPMTGDWSAFRIKKSKVSLVEGKQMMRIYIDKGGFNLMKIVFSHAK